MSLISIFAIIRKLNRSRELLVLFKNYIFDRLINVAITAPAVCRSNMAANRTRLYFGEQRPLVIEPTNQKRQRSFMALRDRLQQEGGHDSNVLKYQTF